MKYLLTRFLAVAITALISTTAFAQAAPQTKPIESLSAAEFTRLINEFSEDGGYFRSDNFTSNETSYLHVVDKMRQLGASGGAYLGVGPEQNFTYIAKVRPRIAFIVDIRRQAIIQHLMYKAVFHLAPDRVRFLSVLFCKPLEKGKSPSADTPINEILDFFEKTSADEAAFTTNLAAIRKAIQTDFQFPLSERDSASLEYVYRSFRNEGLTISYRMENSGNSYFPTLKDIVVETDLNGKQGNFLATNEDYKFVRDLQQKNLIIPVVGDFGGKKAIASVADFLKKQGLPVTAFYTSNVEQYLFGSDSFVGFANNVKRLPITEKSLFIRAIAGRMPHPARVPGHRLATLLQQMTVFIQDFDQGRYQTYSDLISSQYIGNEKQ